MKLENKVTDYWQFEFTSFTSSDQPQTLLCSHWLFSFERGDILQMTLGGHGFHRATPVRVGIDTFWLPTHPLEMTSLKLQASLSCHFWTCRLLHGKCISKNNHLSWQEEKNPLTKGLDKMSGSCDFYYVSIDGSDKIDQQFLWLSHTSDTEE